MSYDSSPTSSREPSRKRSREPSREPSRESSRKRSDASSWWADLIVASSEHLTDGQMNGRYEHVRFDEVRRALQALEPPPVVTQTTGRNVVGRTWPAYYWEYNGCAFSLRLLVKYQTMTAVIDRHPLPPKPSPDPDMGGADEENADEGGPAPQEVVVVEDD